MMNPSDRSREHLANERTFLAWIRTSIGIMAFGFVVVRFSLFVKQLAYILQKNVIMPNRGYSAVLGIILVAFGVLAGVLSYLQYRKVEKQLSNDTFVHSSFLPTLLVSFIVLMGILLIVYLIRST